MKLEPFKVKTEFPTDEEVWVAVPGFEGLYEISTFGQVRSVTRWTTSRGFPKRVRGRIMKISYVKDKPYASGVITTKCDGVTKTVSVNTMMFNAFVKEWPEGYNCLTHLDKDRGNYRLDNLGYSKTGNWRDS